MMKERTTGPVRRAVVLLSGGLDSATAAAIARRDGFELIGLTVRYGQRHMREVEAARALGKALGVVSHHFPEVTLGRGGSALLPGGPAVPAGRGDDDDARPAGVPVTYVPARNLILLSLAAHWAEMEGAEAIFTGFNAVDFPGYPDCSAEFVARFQGALDVGTRAGTEGKAPRVVAPLVQMTKAEIIRTGHGLSVPFELTWSCYKGGQRACGRCDSCIFRLRGFREAGLEDPIGYEEGRGGP